MNMDGMSMSMVSSATPTSTMAMSMTSAMSSASASGMSDMSGMGMDMDGGGSCKISMLWNWYTIDSCFLAASWHNKTKGMFAGSVIGVFLLCVAIEAVRRLGREYDRRLNAQLLASKKVDKRAEACGPCGPTRGMINTAQQVIRGLFYGSQFTAAFLVMLMGMYFNGFILFAIFLGQTTGYILFARDTFASPMGETASIGCC